MERPLDPYSARLPRFSWDGQRWSTQRRWRSSMVFLMRIDRWDSRLDGPLTEDTLRRKYEAQGYRVAQRAYPPGTIVAAQIYDRDKVDIVLSGLLKITLDGESAILAAGDSVYVPRGAMRRVEVVGSTPVVSLEAVLP